MTRAGRLMAAVAVAAAVSSACSSGSSGADVAPSGRDDPAGDHDADHVTPSLSAESLSPSPSPTVRPTPTRSMGVRTLAPSLRPTEYADPAAAATCRMTSGPQTAGGRSYLLALPTTRAAVAVVVDFHGGNQNAAQEYAYSGLSQQGPLTNYAVVTPQGTNGLWNFTGSEPGLPDDVSFVQQIAADLQQAGCSNGRLYTAGISDGADMAVYAACTLPAVRAVYAVAPSIAPRGVCTRKPYVEVHGTADPVVPYTGSAAGSFADAASEPVASRIAYWTSGCGQPTTATKPGTGVQLWRCARRPHGRAGQRRWGRPHLARRDTEPRRWGRRPPGAVPQAALRFFGAH